MPGLSWLPQPKTHPPNPEHQTPGIEPSSPAPTNRSSAPRLVPHPAFGKDENLCWGSLDLKGEGRPVHLPCDWVIWRKRVPRVCHSRALGRLETCASRKQQQAWTLQSPCVSCLPKLFKDSMIIMDISIHFPFTLLYIDHHSSPPSDPPKFPPPIHTLSSLNRSL